jgi:hypothetical protein
MLVCFVRRGAELLVSASVDSPAFFPVVYSLSKKLSSQCSSQDRCRVLLYGLQVLGLLICLAQLGLWVTAVHTVFGSLAGLLTWSNQESGWQMSCVFPCPAALHRHQPAIVLQAGSESIQAGQCRQACSGKCSWSDSSVLVLWSPPCSLF